MTVNPEHPREVDFRCGASKLSYLADLIRVKLSDSASFSSAILHVYFLITQKQVVRIYTQWVIALMEYAKTVRNWAVVDYPAKSVGIDHRLFLGRDLPVAFVVPTRRPIPAGVRLLDLAPESFKNRFRETLRNEVGKIIVSLHSKFRLLCHALGRFYDARAFLSGLNITPN